jgi:hypothetical protein
MITAADYTSLCLYAAMLFALGMFLGMYVGRRRIMTWLKQTRHENNCQNVYGAQASPICIALRPSDRICVSIASFRDSRCSETVRQAFTKADYPADIVLMICEQNSATSSENEMCYQDVMQDDWGEVRLIAVPAHKADGPCMARYWASTLYRGEAIYLQIDAHTFFTKSWDTLAREMIRNGPGGPHKTVYSTYAIDAGEDRESFLGPVPVLSDIHFYKKNDSGSDGVLQFANQYHDENTVAFSRSVSGNFLLAKGSLLLDVPFDPYLNGVYQNEEILHASRCFTHGYNLLSPSHNLVAHNYTRKSDALPVHPEFIDFNDGDKHVWEMFRGTFDHEGARRSRDDGYGFGSVRSLDEFWAYINFSPDVPLEETPPWDWENATNANKHRLVV